jgi:hypothetical protein
MVTHANGTAERRLGDYAEGERQGGWPSHSAGKDKAYDTADHAANLPAIN